LKLHPNRMKSLATRINKKLSAKFYESFKILEKIGEVAYRLKLLDNVRIHPMFHVSLLKKSLGLTVEPHPPTLKDENELLVQQEEILDSRYNKLREHQVLIKWQDFKGVLLHTPGDLGRARA